MQLYLTRVKGRLLEVSVLKFVGLTSNFTDVFKNGWSPLKHARYMYIYLLSFFTNPLNSMGESLIICRNSERKFISTLGKCKVVLTILLYVA